MLCIAFFIGLLTLSCSPKQLPVKVSQYTDVTYISGIAKLNGDVYCATKGGVVKWDMTDNTYSIYTTTDGLPSNILSDIVADGKGTLWIGSVEGVTSFDGKKFKNYGSADGLPSEEINDIALAPDGTVWVGTAKGAAFLSGGRFKAFTEESGPKADPVLTVYFDQGGNIWLGTSENGMYYKTENEWHHVTSKNGIPVNSVASIVQAWDRSMWCGSWAGISRFDGQGWKIFSSMKRFKSYDARQMHSTDKRLWYFTSYGVHASQGGDWFGFTEAEGLISNDVTCGLVVSDDEVYVGTVDGMSVIKSGKIENYIIPSSPVGYNCISIAADDRDRIWLGTWETGLNLFDSGYWTQISGRETNTLKTVRGIVFGDTGVIAFNTTDGIVFENNNNWDIQTRNEGVSGNDVRCGVFDDQGRYWVGTSAGISYRGNNGWNRFRSIHGLPSEDTWACAKGADGTIWFGTAAGIVSFKDNTLTDQTNNVKLETVDVRSITVKGDTVYFGTNNGELIEFANGAWKVYGKSYLGTDKPVYAIAFDSEDRMWIGTSGDGIIAVGEGIHLTIADGLPSNYINALTVGKNAIWAACYGGCAKIAFAAENASAK